MAQENNDVWSLIQAARPRQVIDIGNPEPGAIRRTRVSEQVISGPDGQPRRVDDLATVPGSALYRSKIPPPPCKRCGEDHLPNRQYDHAYVAESFPAPQVSPAMDQAPVAPPLTSLPVETPSYKRVAVYVGRNDQYVVSVEEAPEWDAVDNGTFKVGEDQVLGLVKLARALGVKVQDKTGGDLAVLELG